MQEYFSHPFVSNSKLTELKRELSGQDQQEFPDAFRIGSLADAMITTPGEVDLINRRVREYSYSQEEIESSRQMKRAFFNDPFCAQLFKNCVGQRAFYNESVEFVGLIPFSLPTKCLYDLWSDNARFGADIKTTVAKSQRAFEEAFYHFDYDRSRYWYMRNSGAARDVVIGISKLNYQVFKIFITPTDSIYKSGADKTNDLAFKYWSLKHEPAL